MFVFLADGVPAARVLVIIAVTAIASCLAVTALAQLIGAACARPGSAGRPPCRDPARAGPRRRRRARPLRERRGDNPDRLSGGGRQRLAIACALALESPTIVLDEPTANLDPVGIEEVYATRLVLVAAPLAVGDYRFTGAMWLTGLATGLRLGAGALLAGAIRHAERVALAMDARAFGAYRDRTERHLVPVPGARRRRRAVLGGCCSCCRASRSGRSAHPRPAGGTYEARPAR